MSQFRYGVASAVAHPVPPYQRKRTPLAARGAVTGLIAASDVTIGKTLMARGLDSN